MLWSSGHAPDKKDTSEKTSFVENPWGSKAANFFVEMDALTEKKWDDIFRLGRECLGVSDEALGDGNLSDDGGVGKGWKIVISDDSD